jgi:hypothetical protein
MIDPQIGGNLTQDEARELGRYAKAFQMSRAGLAYILVLRELNVGRLGDLIGRPATKVSKSMRGRVTTRPKDTRVKELFTAHAARFGLGSDEAGTLILREELTEQWLWKTICSKGIAIDSPLTKD